MDKKFLAALGIILALFVGYIYFVKKDDSSTQNTSSNASVTNHTRGNGAKKVTFTEYGDFQCPVCGQYYPILKQIEEKYGNDITFQYRHFPLDTIHPNARAAHRAAEASGKQNKFFEMYDILYTNQSSWSSSTNAAAIFEGYATQLGLNLATFKTDYASSETNDIINADLAEGRKLGVSGTPTFFINGRLVKDEERRSYDDLAKAIDAEIAKASSTN